MKRTRYTFDLNTAYPEPFQSLLTKAQEACRETLREAYLESPEYLEDVRKAYEKYAAEQELRITAELYHRLRPMVAAELQREILAEARTKAAAQAKAHPDNGARIVSLLKKPADTPSNPKPFPWKN